MNLLRLSPALLLPWFLLQTASAAINVALGTWVVAQGNSITTAVSVTDSSDPATSAIEGLTFTYQIDAGTGNVPAIANIDLLTNTVWTGHVSPASVLTPAGGNQPQYQSRDLFTDNIGDVVNTNGTLARVTLSAATAPLGTYTLKLINTKTAGRDTTLLDGMGQTVPATYSAGTLIVAHNGDANLDNKVDAFDLNLLAANWQAAANTTWGKGDFNNDGKVDAFDLNALAANWQFGVGGSLEAALAQHTIFRNVAVPEPASLTLFAGTLPLLIRRRRRSHRCL